MFVCVRVCALRICVHWCSCGGEGWGKPSLTSVEGQGLRLEAQGCLPEHWPPTHVCALRPWPGQISGLWWGLGQAFGCPCEQLTHLFPGLMSTVVSAQGSTQAHLSSGAGYGPSERASPCQRTGCPPGRKPRGIREKGLCRMDRSFLCCEGERFLLCTGQEASAAGLSKRSLLAPYLPLGMGLGQPSGHSGDRLTALPGAGGQGLPVPPRGVKGGMRVQLPRG